MKNKICSIKGCNKRLLACGLCAMHYERQKQTGNPLKTKTGREWGKKSICSVKDCNNFVEGNSYCRKHNKKFKKYGNPLAGRSKGIGKYSVDGYWLLRKPNWVSSRKDGYILEHRYVIEKYLKRTLEKSEIVHHKNGVRTDNRIENLEVLSVNKHHKGSELYCPYCKKKIY